MALADQEANVTRQNPALSASEGKPQLFLASLVLGGFSFLGMMVSIWAIFLYAPSDAIQGEPQRIFYVHVPMAWLAMLAFGVLALASIAYLWKKDERWDWLARATAELGAVFTTLALIT